MAYALYIERESEEITIEEWSAAVGKLPEARLAMDVSQAVNPKTGEVISVPCGPGYVEVLFRKNSFPGFGAKREWCLSIHFSRGKGIFNATEGIESPNNPVHIVASELAHALGAKIVGEEGEVYEW